MLALSSLLLVLAMVQHLTGFPFRCSWKLAAEAAVGKEGRGVEFKLPKLLSHSPDAPPWFAGVIRENGIPLARHTDSRRDVSEKGEGRYWIKDRRVVFAASDATHPQSNGRHYEIRASVAIEGAHLIALSLLWLAAFLISAWLVGARGRWRAGIESEWRWWCAATQLRSVAACWRRIGTANSALLTGAGIGLLVIWRLYAMAGEEIAASQWDPEMYALVALDPGSFGSHPPGVSWLMRAWAELGIPARIGFELFYLAAGGILAAGISQILRSRLLGWLIFIIFALFPASPYFKMIAVEPVVLCSVAMAAGFVLIAVASERSRIRHISLLGAGAALALWEASRIETPLAVATALLAAGVYAVGRSWLHESGRLRSGLVAGGVLLLFVIASWCLVCGMNWKRHGVWAKCAIDLPGERSLLSALYSIDTPDASRFAPVTRATLKTAATASPTIGRRLPALLDPQSAAVSFGETVCERKGEAGPWLNWLLAEVFSQPPPFENAADAAADASWPVTSMNAEMEQAAAEIRAAIARGQLSGRFGVYPLDPNFRDWIARVPKSIEAAFTDISRIPDYRALSDAANYSFTPGNDSLSPMTQAATDAAALRRTSLTGSKWIDLDLVLRKGGEDIVMLSLDIDERPLAAVRCEAAGAGGGIEGVRVRLRSAHFPDGEEDRLSLRLWSAAGLAAAIPWREIRSGRVIHPARADGGPAIEVAVNQVSRMPKSFIREDRRALLEALPAIFQRALPVLIAVALIGGFLAANEGGRVRLGTLWLAPIWLGAALLGRLVFFALLYAMIGWGTTRYLGPLAPVWFAWIIVIAFAVGATARLMLGERCEKPPLQD